MVEISLYLLYALVAAIAVAWYVLTSRKRRELNWPHPPLFISQAKDRKAVKAANEQNAIVLGYDVHGKPWLWPDATRVMQSVVFGATGSGKTTLLKNIITQDLFRLVGPHEDRHRIPMLIFDGKGDQEFLSDLLPAIETAGRMHQLRVLSPSQPDISVRYNPFFSEHGLYQEHANFVFESFDLKEDFFHGHQATYLSDLVRVLAYTGKRFNIHDVLVLALDQQVLREQIAIARACLQAQAGASNQRRLNLEMSVRNLQQSFEDRDRVPKIQGLLNELMTFLEDDLSVITGAYDELLSLDEVIDKELILFVSLNTNKNSKAVTALGRMLLQNMQLMIGKRYENEQRAPAGKSADGQRHSRRVRPVCLFELRPDLADGARHQHRFPFRAAGASPALNRGPRLQRRCLFSAKYQHAPAHQRRGDSAVFPQGIGARTAEAAHPDRSAQGSI